MSLVAIRCFTKTLALVSAYHEEVRLGVGRGRLEGEDAGSAKVLRERHAQMGVVKSSRILLLGRICETRDARLDGEVRLAQPAPLCKRLVCG